MYRFAIYCVVLGLLWQLPTTWLLFIPVCFFWLIAAAGITALISLAWLEAIDK